ncbi:MAG: cell division protein FtsA [Holosporales bacterium]|jgi:cell division protein FtsA|nr:cell division protein FtsA [Holosporales bacterium]
MNSSQSKLYGAFAGLDVGTEKVSCAIGSLQYDGESTSPQVLLSGFGQRASRGVNLSGISDIDALEDTILNAVYAAEETAKKNIKEVYVNIPTSLIQTRKVVTHLSLSGQTPIQPTHIRKLFNLSKNSQTDNSQYIIHVWPLSYKLDDMANIQDPTGMIGEDLSATCHVVMTNKSYIKNLMHCIGRCNLDVAGFVADSYAAGLACLINDEAELGATLLDIGGKSTQIACFYAGNLVWFGSVPIGGFHITSDLARGLSTTLSQAERIKTLYGSFEDKNSAEQVPITQMGKSGPNVDYVSRQVIFEIMKARMDDIFDCVIENLREASCEVNPVVFQKILLTGGACHAQGLTELATARFGTNVRIAPQSGISGQNSVLQSLTFSTCAGLLHYAVQDYTGRTSTRDKKPLSFWQRISLWLGNS